MSEHAQRIVNDLKAFADCEHKSLRCEKCGARADIFGWLAFTDYDELRQELAEARAACERLQKWTRAVDENEQLRAALEWACDNLTLGDNTRFAELFPEFRDKVWVPDEAGGAE